MFINFIDTNFPRIKNITEITKETIAEYMNHLLYNKDKKGKNLNTKTVALKIITLRNFFKYLLKNDYILTNPMNATELPRKEIELPRNILSENEIKLLLESIKTNTPVGLRNKAIIELFYSTGIRTSELCNLKIPDVNLKEQIVIIVKGKGNKTRIVPAGQHACYYIEQYLEKARKYLLKGNIKDEGYLFLSDRGHKFNKETINKYVISQVMKNVSITKKVTCYTFRHSIASALVKNKVDIRYVAQLLGHESLETTKKYVHLEISDLKKMHSLYHPRESGNNDSVNNSKNI
jgi:integrase/recombinase XerD